MYFLSAENCLSTPENNFYYHLIADYHERTFLVFAAAAGGKQSQSLHNYALNSQYAICRGLQDTKRFFHLVVLLHCGGEHIFSWIGSQVSA